MNCFHKIAMFIAMLWAGVSIGGNIIAAVAKFQVQGPGLKTFLQIGQAQFSWLSSMEWVFALFLILILLNYMRGAVFLFTIPIVIFAIQYLFLMPILDERTVRIISGEAITDSSMHLIFVIAEVVKLLSLLTISCIILFYKAERRESYAS